MNILHLVLNWILNWTIFWPDSMKKWIFKTYRPGLGVGGKKIQTPLVTMSLAIDNVQICDQIPNVQETEKSLGNTLGCYALVLYVMPPGIGWMASAMQVAWWPELMQHNRLCWWPVCVCEPACKSPSKQCTMGKLQWGDGNRNFSLLREIMSI